MDKFDKIKELHQLKIDGVLTEVEFESEKQKIISAETESTPVEVVENLAPVHSRTLNESYAPSAAPRPIPAGAYQQQSAAPHQAPIHQTIIYPAHPRKKSNGVGITGFVFAMISLVPYITSPFFAIVGLILSIIGVCLNGKTHKKGLALAGLIVTFLVILGWAVLLIFLANESSYYRRGYSDYYNF